MSNCQEGNVGGVVTISGLDGFAENDGGVDDVGEDEDGGSLQKRVALAREQRNIPPDVDLLIIDALSIPSHPTVSDAYIFQNLVVKIVNIFGTVVAERTFDTMHSYYLSDDTGAIWVNVSQKVHTLSQDVTRIKHLNSRLEKQETTLQTNLQDNIVHGVLKSFMKDINNAMSKRSMPFPLGTVLRVQGWLVNNHEYRKVKATQVSWIEDPHDEAEMMEYVEIRKQWAVT